MLAVRGVIKEAADYAFGSVLMTRQAPELQERPPSAKAQKGAKGHAGSRGHVIARSFSTKAWANVMKIAKVGEAETRKSSKEDWMVGKKWWTM